ncbi:blastoderm-specific protein 25D isoform X3 [Cimex lectularius]|uniref:EF-hand domain-containing protein n=1 Tax=Cimex lectularius TaxID=79782 RepID=A0A8I6S1X2_CIMLE|nr:blastoderm-specific protein 25D isoform X3 [Cimex lectularius]
MESLPRDPYERQLLEVFKSCDCDGKGLLDNDGLSKLCELLHLEDGREELMSYLLPNGIPSAPSVTFNKFRDALLTLLGGVREHENRSPSPVREVSPKYVYGEKKYGRRSRPESIEQLDINEMNDNSNRSKDILNSLHSTSLNNITLCSSADLITVNGNSDDLQELEHQSVKNMLINKECEVSGESELRNAWERLGVGREGYLHPNELAMICSAVGMDTMADQVVTQVFSTLQTDDEGRILFEEFLELFHSKSDATLQSLDANRTQFSKSPTMDVNEISVSGTARLFQELNNARTQLEAVTAERDKLKADLADANHRATILAQEIDEHHARIEKASRNKIELLEQKQQEDIKQLKYQISLEKDQLLQTNQRLEKSLTEHIEQLNNISSELSALKMECEHLEKENRNLNSKLFESETLKKDFQEQLECMSSLHQRVYELESLQEQSSGIVEKINNLEVENKELRDKNDELTIQLENFLTTNLQKKEPHLDCSSGTKRRVKSPELYTATRMGKVRRCCTETDLTAANIIQNAGFPTSTLNQKDLDLEDESFPLSCEQTQVDDDKEKMKAYIAVLEAKIQLLQQKEWLCKSNSRDGDSINTLLSANSTQMTYTSCENSYDAMLPVNCENSLGRLNAHVDTGVQTESPLGYLEKHCHELENELERVRDKIIKILSERRACSEENCVLKQTLQTLMKNNLKPEDCDNNILKASLKLLPNQPKDMFINNCNIEEGSECLTIALTPTSEKENRDVECLKCKNSNNSEFVNTLKEENKRLTQMCQELENSLQLMKDEYEETEDYWQKKLEEERKLYEKDQRQSDEKFADLETKIQEYAELLASEQFKKPTLPPIEENEFLEKQFTDLEEEYKCYKSETEEQLIFKDEKIQKLELALENVCRLQQSVRDESVQTNFGELSKHGSKIRQSSSAPKWSQTELCWCARGKAKERLRSEIEDLCHRKRMLLNQIASLQANSQLASPRMDNMQIFHSLSNRLRQQEMRCTDLQSALKQQQKQTEEILQRAWERHKLDLTTIQNSLVVTQEKLQQQKRNTRQQLEKLNAADALVKDLCSENRNLVQMLMSLEHKLKL